MLSISSYLPVALVALAGFFCDKPETKSATTPELPPVTVKTETIINKREIIWGMDFLPNGDLLFTEKKGTLTRAEENSSVSGQTGRELGLIKNEILRRRNDGIRLR